MGAIVSGIKDGGLAPLLAIALSGASLVAMTLFMWVITDMRMEQRATNALIISHIQNVGAHHAP